MQMQSLSVTHTEVGSLETLAFKSNDAAKEHCHNPVFLRRPNNTATLHTDLRTLPTPEYGCVGLHNSLNHTHAHNGDDGSGVLALQYDNIICREDRPPEYLALRDRWVAEAEAAVDQKR